MYGSWVRIPAGSQGSSLVDNTSLVSDGTLNIYRHRLIPKFDDSVAQLVEQYTFNVWVLGSNPSGITQASQTEAFIL